jgi:hypothetical protein
MFFLFPASKAINPDLSDLNIASWKPPAIEEATRLARLCAVPSPCALAAERLRPGHSEGEPHAPSSYLLEREDFLGFIVFHHVLPH